MDPLYARYPFLADARAAVEAADIDLLDVVERNASPVVDRAIDRIDGAIHAGRVPDPIHDTRVELLSYPVARVLVSLVDDPALTERYALAEARRGFGLFEVDRESNAGMKSSRSRRLTGDDLLYEFGLTEAVSVSADGAAVSVTAYLALASDLRDKAWRLINRSMDGGMVPISRVELDALLREAIRARVAEDLPLDVPDVIAEALADEVAQIESILADVPLPDPIDRVVPAAFPPCIVAAIEGLREDTEQRPIESFAAVTFLCAIGMNEDQVVGYLAPDDKERTETLRYMVRHVHGNTSSTAYPPPGCQAMEAAGACVDEPDRCVDVGHPLAAYVRRIEAYRDAVDWRAGESA